MNILGRPSHVRIFPVDLGLPLIFTDFQQFQSEEIFSQRLSLLNFQSETCETTATNRLMLLQEKYLTFLTTLNFSKGMKEYVSLGYIMFISWRLNIHLDHFLYNGDPYFCIGNWNFKNFLGSCTYFYCLSCSGTGFSPLWRTPQLPTN